MPTGSVTPSGGAAFNGGTITQPLTIHETDGTSKGLVVNTQGGFGVNALEIDAPHTTVTVDGDGGFTFSGDDGLGLEVTDTGGVGSAVTANTTTSPGWYSALQAGGGSTLGLYLTYGSVQMFAIGQDLWGCRVQTQPAAPATTTLTSGVGAVIDANSDRRAVTAVTFNPTAGAAATCAVAISKDGTNYTELWTETEPAGVALDGTIHALTVWVPFGWKLRLTATNATIGTTTYY